MNEVERVMAHLSFPLAGLVLRHDTFGTHLKNGKVVNEELFEKNIGHAAICVAENVWDGLMIENSPVHSEYIPRGDGATYLVDNVPVIDFKWFKIHCRISRHSFQIAKCLNKKCITCRSVRSHIFKLLQARFISPPVAMEHDKFGRLKLVDPETIKPTDKHLHWPDYVMRSKLNGLQNLSMDSYNGELSNDDLKKITCNVCGEQFQNQSFMLKHRRAMHYRERGKAVDVKVDIKTFEEQFDFDLRGLMKCVDFRKPDKYLCVFEDEHIEWMSLHEDLKQVQEYKAFCALNERSNDLASDLICYDDTFTGDYLVCSDSSDDSSLGNELA